MNAWRELSAMKTIGVTNQKGGVAKTTNTINIAGAAAAAGLEVLVADSDPQGYLTNNLGLRDAYTAESPTFFDAWTEPTEHDPAELIVEHEEFDVLPSSVDMFTLEQELIAAGWRVRERLSMIFEQLPEKYDLLLVDAPPSLGPINDNVLLATERIIIPMEAQETSVLALDHLLRQIETLEDRFEVSISEEAVVISDVDYPLDNEQKDMIAWIEDTFTDRAPVFEIRHRAAIARAVKAGHSISGYGEEESDMESVYQNIVDELGVTS
jgi:chromosome partitioning protein